MENLVPMILITVVILVIVFLIFREVACWYWKINEKISLQKDQNLILEEILKELKNNSNSSQQFTTKENGADINTTCIFDGNKKEN